MENSLPTTVRSRSISGENGDTLIVFHGTRSNHDPSRHAYPDVSLQVARLAESYSVVKARVDSAAAEHPLYRYAAFNADGSPWNILANRIDSPADSGDLPCIGLSQS